jgi:hypothetical protein
MMRLRWQSRPTYKQKADWTLPVGQEEPFVAAAIWTFARPLRSANGRSSTDDGVVRHESHDWRWLIDRDDRHKR